jgi:hypothetical protein
MKKTQFYLMVKSEEYILLNGVDTVVRPKTGLKLPDCIFVCKANKKRCLVTIQIKTTNSRLSNPPSKKTKPSSKKEESDDEEDSDDEQPTTKPKKYSDKSFFGAVASVTPQYCIIHFWK